VNSSDNGCGESAPVVHSSPGHSARSQGRTLQSRAAFHAKRPFRNAPAAVPLWYRLLRLIRPDHPPPGTIGTPGRSGTHLLQSLAGWGPSGRWFKSSRPDEMRLALGWPGVPRCNQRESSSVGGFSGEPAFGLVEDATPVGEQGSEPVFQDQRFHCPLPAELLHDLIESRSRVKFVDPPDHLKNRRGGSGDDAKRVDPLLPPSPGDALKFPIEHRNQLIHRFQVFHVQVMPGIGILGRARCGISSPPEATTRFKEASRIPPSWSPPLGRLRVLEGVCDSLKSPRTACYIRGPLQSAARPRRRTPCNPVPRPSRPCLPRAECTSSGQDPSVSC